MEEFTKQYNSLMISTLQESLEDKKYIQKLHEKIKGLGSDNEKLQSLNKKLSERVIQLKAE